jgi:L-ribulose-5-phosphate 3-epimerase UlaE
METSQFSVGMEVNPDTSLSGKEMLDYLRHCVKVRVEAMKAYMLASNSDLPMHFEFIASDKQAILFPPFATNLPKPIVAHAMKEFLRANPIVAVIHVCECWALSGDSKDNFEELLNRYGSVRNCPDSVECFNIMVSYNVRGKGMQMIYSAPIIVHPDKSRSLDESKSSLKEDIEAGDGLFNVEPGLLIPLEL